MMYIWAINSGLNKMDYILQIFKQICLVEKIFVFWNKFHLEVYS